jgi:hypothetical protein
MDDFKADLIVNASGLGARELANDGQVFPVRGAVKRISLDAKNVKTVSPNSNHECSGGFEPEYSEGQCMAHPL